MSSVETSRRPTPSATQKKPRKHRLFSNFCYDFVYITGALPMLVWLRPKMHYPDGKPHKRGALLALANHTTFIDPILVQLAFPFRRMNTIATKDLYTTPLREKFFNVMHCIKIDKENFSMASFHDVVERLDDGKMVVIFPEGTVHVGSKDQILAFKSGVVLMAHKSGAPVVPMYVAPRAKWYSRQHIVMGQPIDVREMLGRIPTVDKLASVSDALREKELELRAYYDSLSNAAE